MTKSTLLLGGIISYLIGLYLSPQLLPATYLTSLIVPLIKPEASPESSHEKPIELPPLPPSLSPGNTAERGNRRDNEVKKGNTKVDREQTRNEASHTPIEAYNTLLGITENSPNPFKDIQLIIHRNGEADPCSSQHPNANPYQSFHSSSKQFNKPLPAYNKYDFDALLTHALAVGDGAVPNGILSNSGESCGPTWDEKGHYLDAVATTIANPQGGDGGKHLISPFLKFCDMGADRTPIQLDHGKLIRLPKVQSLPCHYHTREGLRITSLKMLADLARDAASATSDEVCNNQEETCTASNKEVHIYAIPAGRVFVFAPKYIGEIFHLPHVSSNSLPVSLQVLSLSPRVFDIYNFFTRDESLRIVSKALAETSETHRMKRSSTGASGYNVNSQRTSENGFDTHGKEAQVVKRRCMNVLGFDEYQESLTDGLQVLRYNLTTAYIPHLDWIDDYQKREEHDYDSGGVGSNRFATILLYMSDLEEGDGGETVFSKGWPANVKEEDRVEFDVALEELRKSGDVKDLLVEGSWEESMVARCRSRLAVRPHSSRAVLFYSQNPDGTPDHKSLHGGCPVISGEKWAANLWVWNAPRGGFPGAPTNKEVVERNRAANKSGQDDMQKKASFSNSKTDPQMKEAQLYFQETFWGNLGFDDAPLHVNTFKGHEWNVRVGDEVVKKFVINDDKNQAYTV